MRSLHADLTTAQQSASATPYVRLAFTSRDRQTTRTYATDDATNRIVQVQAAEGTLGGQMAVAGGNIPVECIVRLRDHDDSLVALDWDGYRLDLGWGFNTASGNKYSEGGPYFVVRQRSFSLAGETYLELQLTGLWGLASVIWVHRASADTVQWERGSPDEATVKQIIDEMLAGDVVEASVMYDGSSYTKETDDAQDLGSADVQLFDTNPAVGDIHYWGMTSEFDRITFEGLSGVANITVTWEYWDNAAWSALSNVTDDTSGFSSSNNPVIVSFDRPSNWTARNMSGVDAAFPNSSLFYVRARITAESAATSPTAGRIFAGHDFAIEQGDGGTATGYDYPPDYAPGYEAKLSQVVEDILLFSDIGVIADKRGFKLTDVTQTAVDYTYGSGHTVFVASLDNGPTIPNRIEAINIKPGDSGTEYTDQADDTASQASIGILAALEINSSIQSDADATLVANRRLEQLQERNFQGAVEAPMNCGQEIWDTVQVQDSRSGQTFNGKVTGIYRIFESGVYRIRLELGVEKVRYLPRIFRRADPNPEWYPLSQLEAGELPPLVSPKEGRFLFQSPRPRSGQFDFETSFWQFPGSEETPPPWVKEPETRRSSGKLRHPLPVNSLNRLDPPIVEDSFWVAQADTRLPEPPTDRLLFLPGSKSQSLYKLRWRHPSRTTLEAYASLDSNGDLNLAGGYLNQQLILNFDYVIPTGNQDLGTSTNPWNHLWVSTIEIGGTSFIGTHASLSSVGTSDHHSKTVSGEIDHGSVIGLSDDDHTQYLLANGTRQVSGDLIPAADSSHDLGENATPKRWAILHVDQVDVRGASATDQAMRFNGTSDSVTSDPTTDAPADWVKIGIGALARYIPVYTI